MVRVMGSPPVAPGGRPLDAERDQIAATVGSRLRELRREYGLSLRDLERRSGVTRSTISRVERGLRRPRPSLLGWLAWGLNPDLSAVLRRELCGAAGMSLIAESRWSERAHGRRAWRAVLAGQMPLPAWLAGPYSAAIFGDVLPDQLDMLTKAQEAAQSGALPWPEGARGTPEVLYLGNELLNAPAAELRAIGRAYVSSDRVQRARSRRRQVRERNAALGLTGQSRSRPPWIPWQS
jgi:transcriptional regulator with XRE-family HTH domain